MALQKWRQHSMIGAVSAGIAAYTAIGYPSEVSSRIKIPHRPTVVSKSSNVQGPISHMTGSKFRGTWSYTAY